ncbi:MAG: fructose-bisphosphatase class II [Desulfosarcina sp.]|nr:fructose-bisphosphatase class II [Desulfosarcina sp.]MBC2742161.1 fructose-bisphosphatase class II [Desulfosarcina sp.]MBC2765073.1 fructose-bisphosphatase class II [Desulfosarcina sp.]
MFFSVLKIDNSLFTMAKRALSPLRSIKILFTSNNIPSIHKQVIGVKKIEVVKTYQKGKRRPGIIESKKRWIIHTAAQVLLSAFPYRSRNKFVFNQIRADEHAAFKMFHALDTFFNYHPAYRGVVRVGEDQRYGVPGIVTAGEEFGLAGSGGCIDTIVRAMREVLGLKPRQIELSIDVLEASGNIIHDTDDNRSCFGTVVGMGCQGDFHDSPDILYCNKHITSPLEKGKYVDLDLDRPIGELLPGLAQAKGKKVSDLTVALLFRERHIDSDEKGLIKQLMDARITVADKNFDTMRKNVRKCGIYNNGNMFLLSNDFFAGDGLDTGMLDFLCGVGRPTEAENSRIRRSILGGDMRMRLASHAALKNGNEDIILKRDEQKFSPEEIGKLRKKGMLDCRHVQSCPAALNDMGMAIAYGKNHFWDEDIRGMRIDPVTGQLQIDVKWLGASGEAQLIRITYESSLPVLKRKIAGTRSKKKKAALYAELAACYLSFGMFDKAIGAIQEAVMLSDDVQSAKEYRSIHFMIEGYKDLVADKKKTDVVESAIEHLSQAVAVWPNNHEAKRLLRRLCNYLADSDRNKGEALEEDTTQKKAGNLERISEYFTFAEIRYTRALENFPPESMGAKQQFDLYLKTLRSRFKQRELARDRLEYELVGWQHKAIKLKLEKLAHHDQWGLHKWQIYYHSIGEYYGKIATQYERDGFHHRAVVYRERALRAFEIVSDEFGGLLPEREVVNMAEIYMKADMYESALKTYARLIDPKKAFKAHTEKAHHHDEALKKIYFEGDYSFFFQEGFLRHNALLKYVLCYSILMDEPIEFIHEMKQRIKKWLQDDGGASFETWAKEERLFTDDEGILWLKEKSEAVPITKSVQTSLLTNYLARSC